MNNFEQATIDEVARKESLTETVIEEATRMPEVLQYDFPEISYESIDVSPTAIAEMASQHADVASLAKDGLKITIQSLFGKYMPAFKAMYDGVQGFLAGDVNIRDANRYHVYDMADRFMGDKDSIFHRIKKSGLTTKDTQNLVRKVEKALMDNTQ